MIYSFIIVSFIIYSIFIFNFNSLIILSCLFFIQLLLAFILKMNINELFTSVKRFLPFVIFTILVNLIMSSLLDSILVGYKLLIVCNLTYILGKNISCNNLATGIGILLYPLKLFKISTKDITMIIIIAISFIPILVDEIICIKKSLKSKNFNLNIKNIITKPHIFIATYLNSIFNRIDEVEKVLISKNYC